MPEKGRVKWFDGEKGYGYIIASSGEEIFVHHTSVKGEDRVLNEGDEVDFTVSSGRRGKEAINVVKRPPGG